ncbi:uncharacterized protein LOC132759918 [Ruditapes philippinarum]|uniref:uncharacterized protein LOC132759918 n=1 Tax=Ruditapes philippinarum TaxID=129788 RepID=UPI00295B6C70|nr:uncharacterized protein LOC132759918 [Ruditapes philippinarum]
MLTSPVQYANLPQTIYKSQCGSKQMCDVLTHLPSDPRCTSLCCGTDYCNDHCEVPTHVTTVNQHTIQGHITHTSDLTTKGYTVQTTKAQQFHCNISNNYVHLYTSTVHLCVHFVRHQLNFTDARMACQHEGADLVVLDTYEKSLILRGELARRNIHRSFWIGASGSKASNLFSWVNRSHVDRSEADWGEDLENVCGHVVQDCVAMVKYGHKWTTCNCGRHFYYVCQR